MNRENQLTLPPAPNLIGAIRSGFDATANHMLLILFPIILDLILWVGPRLRLTELINSLLQSNSICWQFFGHIQSV
jgi:hypothetical protein